MNKRLLILFLIILIVACVYIIINIFFVKKGNYVEEKPLYQNNIPIQIINSPQNRITEIDRLGKIDIGTIDTIYKSVDFYKPGLGKYDSNEKKYVELNKISDDLYEAIFVKVNSLTLTRGELPNIIEVPFLNNNSLPRIKNNEVSLRKLNVLDATADELFYYYEKIRFYPYLDTLRLIAAKRLRNDLEFRNMETQFLNANRKAYKRISLIDWVNEFFLMYKQKYTEVDLKDLPLAIKTVIQSVKSSNDSITELQKTAFYIDARIYSVIAINEGMSILEYETTKKGNKLIIGSTDDLTNLLYHHWIYENPNILKLPKSTIYNLASTFIY